LICNGLCERRNYEHLSFSAVELIAAFLFYCSFYGTSQNKKKMLMDGIKCEEAHPADAA
jgi:hypothetical protein